MHNDPEGRKMWRVLRDSWQETQQKAILLRAQIVAKEVRSAAGKGADPTRAELDALDELERFATRLSVEMDNFVMNRLS